ncbi:MAG: VTT domain-containing protein [Chloroflexi bacterium]|nr:VTT domain-containing protein [Chloroflexota bacterium]MDA1281921.1 VTT domain-containing protein [Chloroflexota bacterium]
MTDQSDQISESSKSNSSSGKFAKFVAKHNRTYQTILWAVVIASVVGGTVAWVFDLVQIGSAGYWGVFLANLIGSAAVIVPIPGWAAVCAAATSELGLNSFGLAVAAATGATIGEITGYLAGYGSQGVIQKSRYYNRIHTWVVKRGGFALFILAVIPIPLFDIAGIAAGSLGYPIRKFFLWVGIGKLIKFVIIVEGCRQSIYWLVDLL